MIFTELNRDRFTQAAYVAAATDIWRAASELKAHIKFYDSKLEFKGTLIIHEYKYLTCVWFK